MARFLVGFDGSPASRRALRHAMGRAAQTQGEVVLLNVLPPAAERSGLAAMMPAGIELPPSMSGTFLDTARTRLEETLAELQKSGVKASGLIKLGETAPAFLATAEEVAATELVIGHKSYSGPTHALGPNADAILRGAKVPVTVVP